jgi:hypothetical protein
MLAWRVKGLLEALAKVAEAHEHNIMVLIQRPPSGGGVFHADSAKTHIERAQHWWLLVIGFGLIFASAVLNLAALLWVFLG